MSAAVVHAPKNFKDIYRDNFSRTITYECTPVKLNTRSLFNIYLFSIEHAPVEKVCKYNLWKLVITAFYIMYFHVHSFELCNVYYVK
jgi:hypothetical protein